MKTIQDLFDKIDRLNNVVLEDKHHIYGMTTTGNKVDIKVGDWKLDNGSHNVAVNFSVNVRIDGVHASRWDMCFDEDQKKFRQGWVKLVTKLQTAKFKAEYRERDQAKGVWNLV